MPPKSHIDPLQALELISLELREMLKSLANTGIYARLNTAPVSKALEANSSRMMGVQS